MSKEKNHVSIGNCTLDGNHFALIAGPCSIESKEQFTKTWDYVTSRGANMVRGGIYKMRTQPDSFQGLGQEALDYVQELRAEKSAPFVSEITDTRQVDQLYPYIDCFQVGSRNMYNYELLKELGRQDKPILLKRGFSATLDEWLKASDYILQGGNTNIILCERGIRSFDKKMRNLLDLSSVAYLKVHSDFPVVVDPSHGTGLPEIIPQMACAAIACGADGLIVEVHPDPKTALSDGFQALDFDAFNALTDKIQPHLKIAGKELVAPNG